MRNPLIAVHRVSEVRRLSPCGRIDCPSLLVILSQDTPGLPPREGESARLFQMEDFRSLELARRSALGEFRRDAGRRLKTLIRLHATSGFPPKLTVRRSAKFKRPNRAVRTNRLGADCHQTYAAEHPSTGERRGARNANRWDNRPGLHGAGWANKNFPIVSVNNIRW